MATFEAKITSKGQITLPAAVRTGMRVDAGDKVIFTQTADGYFRIDAMNRSLRDLRGFIKSGEKVSGVDVKGWIEQARGSAMPAGLKRAVNRRSAGR